MVGAAGIPSAGGGDVFRYRFPERMPSLPSTVPVYRLRPTLISPAEIQAITATFSGLRPRQGTNGLEFTNPDEQVQFTPTSGEIMYTNLYVGIATTPATAPSTIARHWLQAHRLFPTHAGPLTTTVTPDAGWTTVNIVPALQPALLTGAQIPTSTVAVDNWGVVTSAQIRWATAEAVGTTALISPSAATRADEKTRTPAPAVSPRNGQPSPLFTVTRVTLAYQPIAEGATFVLRPVYLFRGTLEGRPFSQTVAAVAR